MKQSLRQQLRRQNRTRRVRATLHGTAARPRLSVHRSNKHVYIQAINDDLGVTLAGQTDRGLTGDNKTLRAQAAAQLLAETLKKQGVKAGVFDRGGYRYHGRVRAIAETLRTAGMEL